MEVYGNPKPFNYLDHYHLIDLPIEFFISMNDSLVRADDVVMHYTVLKKHHKDLARMKLFQGFSHIDFHYQSHHIMMHEIMKTLKKYQTPLNDSSQLSQSYVERDRRGET